MEVKAKLRHLTQKISGLLSAHHSFCLWFSTGSDSRLLLEIALKLKYPFDVLCFTDGWTPQQIAILDALTIKYGLKVFSYLARHHTIVGNEKGELAAISAYAVSSRGQTMSLFRDIVPGDRCAFDVPALVSREPWPPMQFKTMLIGTKRNETHWAMNGKPFLTKSKWKVGETTFFAPLCGWNDAEVVEALKAFGVEWQKPPDELDTGNVAICECLRADGNVFCKKQNAEIADSAWDPIESLRKWQKFSGIGV